MMEIEVWFTNEFNHPFSYFYQGMLNHALSQYLLRDKMKIDIGTSGVGYCGHMCFGLKSWTLKEFWLSASPSWLMMSWMMILPYKTAAEMMSKDYG